MKIELHNITVRDIVSGFTDNGEGGVTGMDGALDIRPPYQREFVYKEAQQVAVLNSVTNQRPLNVLYFSDHGDGDLEVLDGQQRILSLCSYVTGGYAVSYRFFHNLNQDEKDAILDYELLVYYCSGTSAEKLEWFKTINISGEALTDQELRNAVYHGTWLFDAKKWFSKTGGPAATSGENFVKGAPIRQELLQTALKWVCLRDGYSAVEEYMAEHQHDPNATDLWSHYSRVIEWAKSTFPVIRKELKAVPWGQLYNDHGASFPDGKKMEARVAALMADEDVTRKAGIYSYVLDGQERHLSIRAFTPNQKREAYERQQGICPVCGDHFELAQMQADHITPWSKGGRTISSNCALLCEEDNRRKTDA